MRVYKLLWLLVIGACTLSGCKWYSFTGASISPDIKTISISNFLDRSGLGPPTLSQNFTEKLRDYYQRNTSLAQVKSNGDLKLEGSIIGYTVTPLAATAQQIASQNRLTITVQVKYINTKDKEGNVEQNFSFYADFPQELGLSSVERNLIETISDQIILDIFNKTVANW